MVNKNITMRTLNDDGAYNKLYPQTSATQSEVSADTQQLFGQSTVDACLDKLANTISTLGRVLIKVVDANNNPIEGAVITGISGQNVTDAQGRASGILINNPITVKSPYVDLQDTTVDASDYTGSLNTLTVTLPIAGENAIRRFTTSKSVTFSKMLKTVDICCVGGGGGGSGGYGHHAGSSSGSTWIATAWKGKGGGGGNIVNTTGIAVTADTAYPVVIGTGGTGSQPLVYNASHYGEQRANTAGTGGTTSFGGVSATGGTGGSTTVGTSTNGGNGNANATGTEFNDGVTYYSGGGANGGTPVSDTGNVDDGPVGGSPYGAHGGYTHTYNTSAYPGYASVGIVGGNGLGPGGGGGGGNADLARTSDLVDYLEYMTKGGNGASGAVAIRFHF